ncbi:MAG: hypothetical protein GY774_04945 [Planctomycetes bacterium]|nr:hypothetical protein [Planctomycetota bacterium]
MARDLESTGKHLIRILRQGGQAANELGELLSSGNSKVKDKILKAVAAKATLSQLTALIHREVATLGKDANKLMTQQGLLAGQYQAISTAKYLTVLGVSDPKVYEVTKAFVRRSFKTPFPVQNISVDNMLKGAFANLDVQLTNIVRTARIQGQPIRAVATAIEEASKGVNSSSLVRRAQAIARTAVTQIANDVRFKSFDREEEVRGVLFVATLDHRTSNVCKVLDGEFYKEGNASRVPPLHVNCRSTLVPILRGESLKSAKDKLSRPAVEVKSVKQLEEKGLRTKGGRIRKPSKTGRSPLKGIQKNSYVTYEQWLKLQPVAYQKEILGNKAFKIFRDTKSLNRAVGSAE